MRVAVTGATGNLGTGIVPALVAEPEVTGIVAIARRRPPGLPARTTFATADIAYSDLAPTLAGCDVLVHLAWAFQPTHDPLRTWEVNVRGGIATFEAAVRAGVRTLVHVSSVGAYSAGPGRHVDEDWPTHARPTAAYGREKSYLERYLDAFELRHPDLRVVRLRPCFVFQRPAAGEQARIFAGPLLPRTLVRPGRLPVITVPRSLRFQAVHADDLADVVRRVVTGDARGAFNVATDDVIDAGGLGEVLRTRVVTVPDTAAVLATAGAWRLRLIPSDDQLLRLLLGLPTLDSGRARRELGWRPVRTGHQALREALTGMADTAGAPTAPLHPGR
ncbi:NAD-dependent epimerase/dehydratase family protein [Jiangella rhizosphaerae]|uniref:NAD-dependent epimerase/dehydratase family protein n=1 Tax=Jiangella rhizosphaerae TaxID=2293569 RepID=A0A418KI60_9ACTN|nr:NAD-dependent epimerase/dehydratase family protein [Jiangella rhizosphaerae]RIQ12387.1 NAD-dependent epimerase/dehydratase family protein [Jiangella rhizosphaerae]